jgi:hypothetical protein
MTSFVTDFETHAIWQGYIEDPTAKDFVARKARTIALSKAQGSCHKISDNQPYSRVWKSLGDSIPELYSIAWLGLGHTRKCQFEDFGERERYDSCSVQQTFAPETFGKRRKRKNSPVVRLLLGSHKHLASRNPCVLCQKHVGTCTTY